MQEVNFGSYAEYRNEQLQDHNTSLLIGGWYRMKDALVIAATVKYRNVSLGVSYDVNPSSVTQASQRREGPEVAIIYVGSFSG